MGDFTQDRWGEAGASVSSLLRKPLFGTAGVTGPRGAGGGGDGSRGVLSRRFTDVIKPLPSNLTPSPPFWDLRKILEIGKLRII